MRYLGPFAAALVFLALAACSQLVAYQARPLTGGDPLRVVEQVLKEQPGKWAPVDLVIDSHHFELKRNRRVPISVYFTNVKEIQVYRKGSEYQLRIIDKGNQVRLEILTYQEEQAYRFVDAMSQLATNNAQ